MAIAVECRGIRRWLPWIAAAIDVEVAMEYAVAVSVVLPWVTMAGPTEVATDTTTARAMAATVALAVEAPCTMESRGPCGGNPRISTVDRGKTHGRPRKCHGHCRGPPQKSQIMRIRRLRQMLLAAVIMVAKALPAQTNIRQMTPVKTTRY